MLTYHNGDHETAATASGRHRERRATVGTEAPLVLGANQIDTHSTFIDEH